MKKRILAVFLAAVMVFCIPVLASTGNESNDLQEATEQFLALISPEAADRLDAAGEGFTDALVAWVLDEAEFYGMEAEELFEMLAFEINNTPYEWLDSLIYEFAWWLEVAGFWYVPSPVAGILAEVTRDDVAAALEAVIASVYWGSGLDLNALMEEAGITDDVLIDMFSSILTLPGEADWFIMSYGELWLEHLFFDILDYVVFRAMTDIDEGVFVLRVYGAYAKVIRYLGIASANEILWHVDSLAFLFGDESALHALIYNPRLGEVLSEISAHDEAALVEIFSFDLLSALVAFVENDNLPRGFMYLDELLDGYLNDNRETVQIWLENFSQSDTDWWTDEEFELWQHMDEIFNELFTLYDLGLPGEHLFLENYQLEQRFTHRITGESNKYILMPSDFTRLNMHFANRGESPVRIVYFLLGDWDLTMRMDTLELDAGGRFSTQIILQQELANPFGQEWLLFFLSPDGRPIDLHFAYRPTIFPRGHYTHGSH